MTTEPLPLPKPLYSCAHCADEYSWPAQDLNWSESCRCWVCCECWEHESHGEKGTTLADEIIRQMTP